MAEQENIDTLMAVLKAFNENDIDTYTKGLHPELTYVIRGRARISGTFRGPDEMGKALRQIKDLTRGTAAAKPEVILAEGDNIMMYAHVTARRPDDRQYDNYHAYLYRFRDGKIIEGQTIPVDQIAFEEFYSD